MFSRSIRLKKCLILLVYRILTEETILLQYSKLCPIFSLYPQHTKSKYRLKNRLSPIQIIHSSCVVHFFYVQLKKIRNSFVIYLFSAVKKIQQTAAHFNCSGRSWKYVTSHGFTIVPKGIFRIYSTQTLSLFSLEIFHTLSERSSQLKDQFFS